MIKNIIFDFDGVIVDSEFFVAKSISKYLLAKGINFSEKEVAKLAGNKTIEVISIISKKFNIKDERVFFDDIIALANNLYSNDLQPINNVRNFMTKTDQRKFIGSNNIKERILIGLKKVKLDNFFSQDTIYSFDLVGIPKPNPDIYLKAIEDSKLNTNETIIIEDSSIGIQAGAAAGIKVIGLTAGGHWFKERSKQELYDAGAYDVVNNYKEMLILLSKL